MAVLADRAARFFPLDDLPKVLRLLSFLSAWDRDAAIIFADRIAEQVSVEDPWAFAELLDDVISAGAVTAIAALIAHKPSEETALESMYNRAVLNLQFQRRPGRAVTALAHRVAGEVPLDDAWAVVAVLHWTNAPGVIAKLLARGPARHVGLDDPWAIAALLDAFRREGAEAEIRTLLAREPAQYVALSVPYGVAELMQVLREVGAAEESAKLLARHPARYVDLDDTHGVTKLLQALRTAGAYPQIRTLLARDPAKHIPLDNPAAVADFLNALPEEESRTAAAVLLERDLVPKVKLAFNSHNEASVKALLRALGRAEAATAANDLAECAANAGLFQTFIGVTPVNDQLYRFGREPDGTPSPRWGWDDLT